METYFPASSLPSHVEKGCIPPLKELPSGASLSFCRSSFLFPVCAPSLSSPSRAGQSSPLLLAPGLLHQPLVVSLNPACTCK